ncbi:NTP transferase domain-containing protein [Histophilus somni]|uniref:NTP transferase domain-containing protein n=1 Tax=Histophilus somni TaxID=731 RepID=UPI00094B737F|nr:NTP transferase domain-containing protein [Histophilus somni]
MNAIILAAGLGSRFREITQKKHKALLPLPNGIPNIEQTIIYLKQAGIHEIHIVTGYFAEQFDFLSSKYGVNLIYNNFYKNYNNIYSFYCAIDYFGESFVIDSDVTLFSNIFNDTLKRSQYFLIQRNKSHNKEWIPIVKDNKVIDIIIDSLELPSLLGVSFWSNHDAVKIKSFLADYVNNENLLLDSSLYWDNIPMENLKELDIGVKLLNIKEAYEIDNLSEYDFIFHHLKGK